MVTIGERSMPLDTNKGNLIMYEETLTAFDKLLKKQLHLFSFEQRNELFQKLKDLITLKDFSNAIIEWCEQHPHIDQLLDLNIAQEQRCAGGGGGDPISPEELEKLKQEIINTIRVSSSPNNKPSESK